MIEGFIQVPLNRHLGLHCRLVLFLFFLNCYLLLLSKETSDCIYREETYSEVPPICVGKKVEVVIDFNH